MVFGKDQCPAALVFGPVAFLMLVLGTLPLETVLEGDPRAVQAALEPCVHTLTCGAYLGCGCVVLRHHSYNHKGFRRSMFSMGDAISQNR